MLSSVIAKLTRSLGNDKLRSDVDNFPDYFGDAMIDRARPGAIVFAESVDDIIITLKICGEFSYPVVPRGAGTGLSGGCVPLKNAIVLSLEKLTSLTIDSQARIAYAQPGVITKTVMDEANQCNLTFPPDPASFEESTIGGNIAENAGGLRCLKYGVTRDYILGLKCLTIKGEKLATGIYNQNNSLNYQDIIIGSEGTLVIVYEAALQLTNLSPVGETILAAFSSPTNAAAAVRDIRRDGIIPIVLEFMDGDACACSNEYENNDWLDSSVGAVLIMEAETELANKIEWHCNNNRHTYFTREENPDKSDNLWKVRRNLSKAAKAAGKIRLSEDIAVPNSKFPDLVSFVGELNASSPLRINSFGHAGDGNLHVNFLSKEGTEDDRKLIDEAVEKLMEKTIALGGTVSGEHGIGTAKRKYLSTEFNQATIAKMKSIKQLFDPQSQLNPDKIF